MSSNASGSNASDSTYQASWKGMTENEERPTSTIPVATGSFEEAYGDRQYAKALDLAEEWRGEDEEPASSIQEALAQERRVKSAKDQREFRQKASLRISGTISKASLSSTDVDYRALEVCQSKGCHFGSPTATLIQDWAYYGTGGEMRACYEAKCDDCRSMTYLWLLSSTIESHRFPTELPL
ncbi:hypothetical protein BJ508DRAFT_335712 [Ascobolus immersus RN42]|uniref:Uncharacterized protein n=1 Tax=Ascobolus immersus RN42 TaxID=1160509 RepID=A0A3N4HBC1_ASCIM|nr:hypothetical protein BJ508DRAFT_335712 [Ascobolus immersus RN42]